ncbi:hybrid sensor histidine kinase/response regulator [Pseudodesulfovibrio sp. zrk46]|uniref:hybrid sensor histidine kinase/response regulator n=1 Tax=Pseudodesulfovibrio sp. zrk46 TaxID=2725288 RepID=UPI0014499CBA|nr:hybrid sensor histidine kinase/response regulator [Pseudodesulfovibrio sp. zrk46]QJB58040.1 response regulator [Pseudodesulfovibrio sp. zrk46]
MGMEKILVVEDDALARLDIQSALERAGYVIAGMAASGEEAIMQANELAPDLVLMDIRLEGAMDGVEAAGEIGRRFDIPIIFLTVYADDETLHWAKISGPYGYLLKPVDHTELKSAIEVGLYKHQMERELRQAKREAETASRAKTAFLATISHELRTPMNGVLGMTELLLLSDLENPYRENVQLIKESAMSLLSVLNQIIDYSKLETSTLKLREVDFRFEDLVTGLLSQYEKAAQLKGVKLEYSVSPDMPAWLRGDSGKMRQVLGNLVNNAVKFTRSGQVMVDVTPTNNDSAAKGDESYSVQVIVQDTGIGIPPEKLDKMFDSFTLNEDHLSHTSGGLGLGLAIVNRLVNLLGGNINCSSQEGVGSIFSFVVPLKRSHYEEQTPLAAAMAEKKPLEGVKLLVAEDDLVSQRYIMRLLEKMGAEVVLAEDGMQAVDALKAERFDVVLMDVEMPIMNGIEATRAIRQPDTACIDPDVPIIALTAHAMWGDEQRCLHAGMDDYVPKPVDIDTVTAIIQSTLDK